MKRCESKRENGKARDFHRQVRVVYRACRRLYGIEKTQDECLKVFKVVFPELYRLRNSDDERVEIPQKLTETLLLITNEWNPKGELKELVAKVVGQMQMPFDWGRDELMQFYEDIMPVAMRIRKLTPTETGRLMGLRDDEIQKMYDAGLSNSAMYKLHGNSIVVDVMTAIFDKLLVNTEEEKKAGMQLTLF